MNVFRFLLILWAVVGGTCLSGSAAEPKDTTRDLLARQFAKCSLTGRLPNTYEIYSRPVKSGNPTSFLVSDPTSEMLYQAKGNYDSKGSLKISYQGLTVKWGGEPVRVEIQIERVDNFDVPGKVVWVGEQSGDSRVLSCELSEVTVPLVPVP